MTRDDAIARAMGLPCWQAPENPRLLGGGITNLNVRLTDAGCDYVVRVGEDIPVHQVMRFNEVACHRAAHAIGVSPGIVHVGEGILAMEFVEGKTLDEADIREDGMIDRIVPLLRRLHHDGARAVRGPVLTFWVFHVIRDYAARLAADGSRHAPALAGLLEAATQLEQMIGPVEIVLGHNDLLPANFIDAGDRLWLLDWDYGGFNSPLFDLAGLASNAELDEAQERRLLELYYATPAHAMLWRRYGAMKCASLLRETMWSMVSEIHSEIDFDYRAYTAKNRARFDAALNDLESL